MLCEKPPSDNLAGFAPSTPLENLRLNLLDLCVYSRDLHDQLGAAGGAIPANLVIEAVDFTTDLTELLAHLRGRLLEGRNVND
jgi:hypothetical protein